MFLTTTEEKEKPEVADIKQNFCVYITPRVGIHSELKTERNQHIYAYQVGLCGTFVSSMR